MTTRKENRKRRQKQFKKDLIDQFLATSDLEEQSKQPDLELKAEYFQLSVMLSIPPTHILNRYYVHDSQGNFQTTLYLQLLLDGQDLKVDLSD